MQPTNQQTNNQLDSYLASEYQGLVDLMSSGYELNLSQKNRLSALADQLGKPNPLTTIADEVQVSKPTDVKRTLFANEALQGAWSLFKFVASVGVTVFVLNGFIFRPYQVDGMSMSPTLTNKDRLIIVKTGRTLSSITRKGTCRAGAQ
jgi:phage repressor protein C with HTH and peptisase S24 domain